MKLKVYNSENSHHFVMGKPTIRIARKAGLISFSKGAIELLKLTDTDRLVVCNDEDSPRDWFLHKTDEPSAFAIRIKGKATVFQFNSAILVQNILDSLKIELGASFKLAKTPVQMDGKEYWPIITANPLGII
jgi:hypothetical protein